MQLDFEFEAGNNKEYEINGIRDSVVYAKESAIEQLPELYYLVLWKGYPEEENIWKPISAIQHLRRLVTAYYKDNPEKPTATSAPVDMAPLMAKSMATLTKKRGRPVGSTTTITKQAKKS